MKKIKHILIALLVFMILNSCASRGKFVYLQNIDSNSGKSVKYYETIIQNDDLLLIYVTAKDRESADPFNLEVLMTQSAGVSSGGQRQQQLYIVDNNGFIDFPVLGKIKIAGLTRAQSIETLKNKLKEYIQDPIINLRIANFKVSVLGEVSRPGSYIIDSERISIVDALAKAGDLTVYGKRQNVLLIRDINGEKKTVRIDLTKSDFVYSEYYYMKQNDVVYVESNKTKVNSSAVGPNITVGLSALSLLVTIIALSIKL